MILTAKTVLAIENIYFITISSDREWLKAQPKVALHPKKVLVFRWDCV